MEELILRCPAKINLFLEIRQKREDGFHEIESVMQALSLSDSLKIEKSDRPGVSLFCDDPSVPSDERNTAFRAASLFFERTGLPGGVSLFLDKKIPHEAGLGGGSSDAAAVLRGLNLLFDSRLSPEKLKEMAGEIGSDVPFFIEGGTQFAAGRGEILSPCPPLPDCTVLIVKDREGMSTPEAYRLTDERKNETVRSCRPFLDAMSTSDLGKIAGEIYNGFEQVVFPIRPLCAERKAFLLSHGALTAWMSGSGTAMCGIFREKEQAEKAAALLTGSGSSCFICHPVRSDLR